MKTIKHHCEHTVSVYDPASTIVLCVALALALAGLLISPEGLKPWVICALTAALVFSAWRINALTTTRRLLSGQREQMDTGCSHPGRVLLVATMSDGQTRECRLSDLEDVVLSDFVALRPTRLCRDVRGRLGGQVLIFHPLSLNGGLLRRETEIAVGEEYRNPVVDDPADPL